MKKGIKNIQEQSKFCLYLMKLLNDELQNAETCGWSSILLEKRSIYKQDIRRIRRELLKLYKLLEPESWG